MSMNQGFGNGGGPGRLPGSLCNSCRRNTFNPQVGCPCGQPPALRFRSQARGPFDVVDFGRGEGTMRMLGNQPNQFQQYAARVLPGRGTIAPAYRSGDPNYFEYGRVLPPVMPEVLRGRALPPGYVAPDGVSVGQLRAQGYSQSAARNAVRRRNLGGVAEDAVPNVIVRQPAPARGTSNAPATPGVVTNRVRHEDVFTVEAHTPAVVTGTPAAAVPNIVTRSMDAARRTSWTFPAGALVTVESMVVTIRPTGSSTSSGRLLVGYIPATTPAATVTAAEVLAMDRSRMVELMGRSEQEGRLEIPFSSLTFSRHWEAARSSAPRPRVVCYNDGTGTFEVRITVWFRVVSLAGN